MTRTTIIRLCLPVGFIVAALAAAWGQGPATVPRAPRVLGLPEGVGGPSFEGEMAMSAAGQADLVARREHCSADPEQLGAIGVTQGQQVRIERAGAGPVLFTVSAVRDESPETILRTGKMGRARFGTGDNFPVRVLTCVPHPTCTDAQAREYGEFIERADDDGRATGLLVLAPHGGAIEAHTDAQAERLAAALKEAGKPQVTTWRCKGYDRPGGPNAFVRWHITSNDTSEASFPLLQRIARRKFAYAVSFHGMTREAVLIGGGGAPELKKAVRDEIDRALAGSGIPVVIAAPGEDNGGARSDNIVNRYCESTGIQIEQSARARREHWRAIADAVARVYSTRL
jgi:phage replication-related protein YjqB (UPF0714/DUF867 family)